MKDEKFKELKESKTFEIGDILVYSALFILLLVLFVFFVITPSAKTPDGFNIFLDGKKIAVYRYDDGLNIINDDYLNLISYNRDKKSITVYVDDAKTEYNVITVDITNKTAKVTDANCSQSKDCVHTPPLGSAIVCAPHKLKITPIGASGFTPPVTGGA